MGRRTISEQLISIISAGIQDGGYFGILVLMTLESMVAPVPSELVMPFAGFLVATGAFTLVGVAAASIVGSVIGSLISYYIGSVGGRPLVLKFGKYLLLDEGHLDLTERFFTKHGEKAIFFARLIPVVRHLISIPAGIGRMNLTKFLLYSIAGAAIWNVFLAWTGMMLRERWELIHQYSRVLDIIVLIVAAVALIYFVRRHFLRARTAT